MNKEMHPTLQSAFFKIEFKKTKVLKLT